MPRSLIFFYRFKAGKITLSRITSAAIRIDPDQLG
jgi:hypothetical protein